MRPERADANKVGTSTAARFPYSISVLLFNRPEYARPSLESLKEQTLPVAADRLVLSIDGYAGSKDEALGRADRTLEVEEIARELFPKACVRRAPRNIGIARHYALVEQQAFEASAPRWAAFFEDDLVLSPRYLEILATLIAYVDVEPRVVQVSATGDTFLTQQRRTTTLCPMWHAWAFALRREHYQERRPIIDEYLRAIADLPYFMRDQVDARSPLLNFGLYPVGTSQDYVKQAVRRHFGSLAVTTPCSYGRYIGSDGEHFTPSIFADLGYEDPPGIADEVPTLAQDISAVVAELYRDDQRAWALEFDAVITSRIESTCAQADVRASNAELRARNAEARLTEARELALEAQNTGLELRALLSHLQALYDDAVHEVAMVRASHSWRFTAGFRVVSGLMRRTLEKVHTKQGPDRSERSTPFLPDRQRRPV